jgi:hypothetical protein
MIRGWIKELGRFGQLGLAGAFVLSAALISEMQGPRINPATALLTELKTIQPAVAASTAVKANATPSSADSSGRTQKVYGPAEAPDTHAGEILNHAREMSSINDFLKLPLGKQASQLVRDMQSDEFAQGNPFYLLNNVYPMAMILEYGVKVYRRDVYRSHQFLGGAGYDVVRYQIEHPDGRTSHILAYKEKTGPNQIVIGRGDARPTFSLFLVPQDQDNVFVNLYQDGQPVQNEIVESRLAVRQVAAKLGGATPLLSAREPDAL